MPDDAAIAVNELWDDDKSEGTTDVRERLVLTLYYDEGLTLAEIGEILGVTESRVSQIHTKAILQLRGGLAEPERESGAVRY